MNRHHGIGIEIGLEIGIKIKIEIHEDCEDHREKDSKRRVECMVFCFRNLHFYARGRSYDVETIVIHFI